MRSDTDFHVKLIADLQEVSLGEPKSIPMTLLGAVEELHEFRETASRHDCHRMLARLAIRLLLAREALRGSRAPGTRSIGSWKPPEDWTRVELTKPILKYLRIAFAGCGSPDAHPHRDADIIISIELALLEVVRAAWVYDIDLDRLMRERVNYLANRIRDLGNPT